MRLIDPKWMDLSIGYQLVQKHQASLEDEFGRAVDIGYKRKYHRELNDWQKKRRSFVILAALVPIPFIVLCISTFYFHEVACVLAWWLLTSLLALMAMVVAGGRYILQMVSGKPVPQRARVAANLAERWWDSLSPKMIVTRGKDDRREADFLSSLYPHLGDDWLAVHNFHFTTQNSTQVTDVLLLGPSGIWVFKSVDWGGSIARQDGRWLQIQKRHKQGTD